MSTEMTIGELANYAAANLPDGWELIVRLTAKECDVTLIDPKCGATDFHTGDSLQEQVRQAVSYAKEHDTRT